MRLAQKTGDTLIVHDKTNSDVVIMDVDRYEMMHDMSDIYADTQGCDCTSELHEMSETEMLDKINRDIAIWRSHKDMDEGLYENYEPRQDAEENLPDFFEENLVRPQWHTAGEVLGGKHPDLINDEEGEYAWDDGGVDEAEELEDVETFPSLEDLNEDSLEEDDIEGSEEVMYDSLGEASLGNIPDKKDVPFLDRTDETDSLKEEPIDDDEPVFFEEPV